MITYKHEPAGYEDILGCSGYPNQESIACFLANGDNNFLNEGIVQNCCSILIPKDGTKKVS